jgi:hypothetical protein
MCKKQTHIKTADILVVAGLTMNPFFGMISFSIVNLCCPMVGEIYI